MIRPSGFKLQRLGMVIEPEPGNLHEFEGILNPAAARGPDGQLYLFPRLVAKGNYSRIGIARVEFNPAGDPVAIDALTLNRLETFRTEDRSGRRISLVDPVRWAIWGS